MEGNIANNYAGGFRHVRVDDLNSLGQLTIDNDNFKQLSIAHTDRKGDPYAGDGGSYRYFRVCPDGSYTFKNYFRTAGNEKRRTGENTQTMREHIRGHLKLENPGNNPKLTALKQCNDVVLNAVNRLQHTDDMHMREWLLLEQVSRQLEKLKGEDVNAGQQIQHTLNWIDDLLASSQFRKIGVGGKLSSQQQLHRDESSQDIQKIAHQQPDIRQEYQPHLDEGGFTGFNGILLQLRNALIDAQVDIESAALHSRKEQDIIAIHNAMQGVANDIAQFRGQFTVADYQLPVDMIDPDNLGTTVAHFSARFDDYRGRAEQLHGLRTAMHEVAQGIEQLAQLDGTRDQEAKTKIEVALMGKLNKVEQLAAQYLQPEQRAFQPRNYSGLPTGKGQTKPFLAAAIESFDKVSRAIGGGASTIKGGDYLAGKGLHPDKWPQLQMSWNQSFAEVNKRHATNLKAMVCDFSEHVLDRLNKTGSASVHPQLDTMRALSRSVDSAMSAFGQNVEVPGKAQALATLDKLYGVVEQKHDYEQFYTHETSRMKALFKGYLKDKDFFSHISPERLQANMEDVKKKIIADRGNGNV